MTTDELLRLLRANNYFERPEEWVEIARAQGFREVKSERRLRCPSCDSERFRRFGQYIYYSSLICLRRCAECDLVYADVLLAPEVIAQHFESAYKDEGYFLRSRQIIFAEIADQVAAHLPINGSVLDVGGAKGHLAAEIRRRRPDARLTVNDISTASCAYAESEFGFEAIPGDLRALSHVKRQFDVVLAIDVVYYEPNIAEAWSTLASLTAPGGSLLLRIPNRLHWIALAEWIAALKRRLGVHRGPQQQVASFNSEHIYIFSRRYLRQALGARGFDQIRFLPSHFLAKAGWQGALQRAVYWLVSVISRATGGRVLLTSSQIVVAKRSA